MRGEEGLLDTARQLRSAFDQAFAEPIPTERSAFDDLLAIRVGPDPYAIRLAEIAGLFVDLPVTRLPGTMPELAGLAGLRGALVPVYDLRRLFGQPGGDSPRWLVVAAGEVPVGVCFDAFDRHLRVPVDALVPAERADGASPYVWTFAHVADGARPVIHLPSILEAIETRVPHRATRKER